MHTKTIGTLRVAELSTVEGALLTWVRQIHGTPPLRNGG